jgi:hypothetical protein
LYKTPLYSPVNKSKVCYLLGLLLNPNEKIRFAFCNDLIIENSFYNENNQHYFADFLLCEFWDNYNNHRKYLYQNVLKHLKPKRETIQNNIKDILLFDSVNRSALLFISNYLNDGSLYLSKISKTPDLEELRYLFIKTNLIKNFSNIKSFKGDGNQTFIECISRDSYVKPNFDYFTGVINDCDNVYVLSDVDNFKKKFRNKIHINENYYLCYNKEIQ